MGPTDQSQSEPPMRTGTGPGDASAEGAVSSVPGAEERTVSLRAEKRPSGRPPIGSNDDFTHPDAVTMSFGSTTPEPQVAPGTMLGRYVVLETIGAGGMGTVARAYDPKLRREVALKRLRVEALDAEAEARLVREAQAMAKLSHPHVVAVYDVDTSGPEVVLAMEYVPGKTLREWVQGKVDANGDGWLEVVRAFVQAGEGLSAAHLVGLVHRDFKPANVLVGEDGRPKVTDFGLAKGVQVDESVAGSGLTPAGDPGTMSGSLSARNSNTRSGSSIDNPHTSLTQGHMVMGTPRYMAPEQHAGERAGPAADQYAFCVALWEALCGEPPFAGGQLFTAKRKGPPSWPKHVSIPKPIVQAITRGLAPNPDARFESMNALLTALSYDPAQRRRRRVATLTATTAFCGSVLALSAWMTHRSALCSNAQDDVAAVWNEGRKAAVRQALVDEGTAFAGDVWARVEPQLTTYAAALAEQRTEACEATTLRGEQSEAVLELRTACLEYAKSQLQAAVDVLARGGTGTPLTALDVVAGLPSLSRCADVEALSSEVGAGEDASLRAAIADARGRLAKARVLIDAGEPHEALALVETLTSTIADLAAVPLQAELEFVAGAAHRAKGDAAAAEQRSKEALRLALQTSTWRVASEASALLTWVVGVDLGRPDDGLAYADMAVGLSNRPDADDRELPRAQLARSRVLLAGKRLEEARAAGSEALQAFEMAMGPGTAAAAVARDHLAQCLLALGQHAAAEEEARRAVTAGQLAYGPEHPKLSAFYETLSATLRALGRDGEASSLEAQTRL